MEANETREPAAPGRRLRQPDRSAGSQFVPPDARLSWVETGTNPTWVASQVDHGPHDDLLSNARIENPRGENAAQEPVVVPVSHAMHTGGQAQPLDVGAQARHEIVAQARLLGLVK